MKALIMCVVISVVIVFICAGLCSSENGAGRSQVASKAHADDGKQDDRLDLIKGLIGEGIFQKVGYDGGSLPKVWVTDYFLSLKVKTQNNFLSVVYAYYNIENDNFGVSKDEMMRSSLVLKFDDGTINGRRIGEYDPVDGISGR